MYQSVCLHNVKLLFFTDRNRILSSVADKVLCCKRAVIFNIDKHAAAKRHKINIMIAGKSVCKPNIIFDNRKIHMVVTCKTALGWAELEHFFVVFYGEQLCAHIVWCGIIGCIAVKRQAIGSSAHTMAQLAFRQFRAAFLYQILCMLFTLLFHKNTFAIFMLNDFCVKNVLFNFSAVRKFCFYSKPYITVHTVFIYLLLDYNASFVL